MPSTYTLSWASIDQHPPAPEWFQDAKFHNFINGARDKAGNVVQFAPKLISAGGRFDPNEWAQLFVDAGARWAGPVAEHHDGFSLWNSRVNEWNSVAKGPRLDLLNLFKNAIRAKNLKLIVSMHHAYHMNGFFDHVPTQSDLSLKKLYGQLSRAQENQLAVHPGPLSEASDPTGKRAVMAGLKWLGRTSGSGAPAGEKRYSPPRPLAACRPHDRPHPMVRPIVVADVAQQQFAAAAATDGVPPASAPPPPQHALSGSLSSLSASALTT